jgi:hypothetical protein
MTAFLDFFDENGDDDDDSIEALGCFVRNNRMFVTRNRSREIVS